MSNYYRFVCDAKRQKIDPGKVQDGCGDKHVSIVHPQHPVGRIICHAMMHGEFWANQSVRAVHDNCEADEDAYQNYEDITHDVLKDWTEWNVIFHR